jgi:hypothetical protein
LAPQNLGVTQKKALDALRIFPDATNAELAKVIEWQINRVTPHIKELRDQGLVLDAGNRLTENSSWDERLLGEQLKVLSELELDFDLEVIGFETAEIDVLIDGLGTKTQPNGRAFPQFRSGNGQPFWKGDFSSRFRFAWLMLRVGKRTALPSRRVCFDH